MEQKKYYFIGGLPNPYKGGLLGVAFDGDVVDSLGEVQQEILYYLTVDFMTVKQISILRKTSLTAVKNVIKKLHDKDLIDKYYNKIEGIIADKSKNNNVGGYPTPSPQKSEKTRYRLHGQNHTLKILSTSQRYFKFLNTCTQFSEDKNTIRITRNKITIYSNTSFYASTPDECFESSNTYWHNFFKMLESKLGVKVFDGFNSQIYQFRCHIAETGNLLAKQVISNKLKYELKDDLGRTRLLIDNSKGLFEFEAVDKEKCQDDINKIKNFHDDLINKDVLPLSEVCNIIRGLTITQKNSIESMDKVLFVLDTLTHEVRDLKDGVGTKTW